MKAMGGLTAMLIDFIFPQPCVLCGGSLLLNRGDPPWSRLPICPECFASLHPIEGRRCTVCGLPLISEQELCTRCRTREFPFVSNRSLYEYAGAFRELISQYKFRGERSLAALFAHEMAKAMGECFFGLPVVPVPSRPRTVRKRGWDHVGAIADLLSRRHGVEVLRLLRRDNGRSQKSLDFTHRLTNLRGRIHWAPKGHRPTEAPRHVVLIDDVFTTGATASECTRILLEHGVERVDVLTLAVD